VFRTTIATGLVAAALGALPAPPASAGGPTCFGREATIVGTPGHDHLEGTEGDDVIVGGGGVDAVDSYGGNDRICLSDGEPQDPQTIHAGDGADRIRVTTGMSNVFGEGGRDLVYGGSGEDKLEGGPMGDRMFGGDGVDYLFGDGGHDVLRGDGGDDVVHGYDGDDVLDGGGGTDKVFFTELCCDVSYDAGGVRIDLGKGTAVAADGKDEVGRFEHVYGSQGDDRILGSPRGETVEALGGNDVLDGRGGDDTLIPDSWFGVDDRADDTVRGGKGTDTIRYVTHDDVEVNLRKGTAGGTGMGTDVVSGVEDVIGGWGNDVLVGNGRDNYILGDPVGGSGRDYLDGRAGDDELDGGTGAHDTCVNGETVSRCEGP
jgi:Ca2+-binding RTX toxin-like protein